MGNGDESWHLNCLRSPGELRRGWGFHSDSTQVPRGAAWHGRDRKLVDVELQGQGSKPSRLQLTAGKLETAKERGGKQSCWRRSREGEAKGTEKLKNKMVIEYSVSCFGESKGEERSGLWSWGSRFHF